MIRTSWRSRVYHNGGKDGVGLRSNDVSVETAAVKQTPAEVPAEGKETNTTRPTTRALHARNPTRSNHFSADAQSGDTIKGAWIQ